MNEHDFFFALRELYDSELITDNIGSDYNVEGYFNGTTDISFNVVLLDEKNCTKNEGVSRITNIGEVALRYIDNKEKEQLKQNLEKQIKNVSDITNNFCSNNLSIMGLFLAIFSIIGINLNVIKDIAANPYFPILLVIINLCIVLSLIIIFYLIELIIYKISNKVLLTIATIVVLLLISLTYYYSTNCVSFILPRP